MQVESVENLIECRICKASNREDMAESPCMCQGTMGYVHITCLQLWLTISKTDHCEVCWHSYNIIRTRKYSCLQSIKIWLSLHTYWFGLIVSIILSFINTMLVCCALFSAVLSLVVYFKYGNEESTIKTKRGAIEIESTPEEMAFSFIFFTVLAMFLTCNLFQDLRRIYNYHIRPWYRWWNHFVDIKIVGPCTFIDS